jgi:putative PIG3 family NAD(P)H quinone oxidoreductase
MRAVILRQYGGPEVLRVETVPDPDPGVGEVLVHVEASAVNRADLLQRRGGYPPPEPRPAFEIPGLEFSGRVVALGPGTHGVAIGDAVMGLLPGGGYADRVVTSHRMLLPVPPGFTFAEAAAVPEAFFTAHDAFLRVGLAVGDTVLIHAAASGVGTSAIQLAVSQGARVLATCSAAKADRVRALGADAVLDYAHDDFAAFVARETAGRGADVILDFVGAGYLEKNVASLAIGGRLIIISTLSGAVAPMDLRQLMQKRAAVMGTALRSRPPEEKMQITQHFRRHVWPLMAAGRVRPIMDRMFPLDQAADAHRRMEANLNIGKIGLSIGADAERTPGATL